MDLILRKFFQTEQSLKKSCDQKYKIVQLSTKSDNLWSFKSTIIAFINVTHFLFQRVQHDVADYYQSSFLAAILEELENVGFERFLKLIV